MSLSSLHAIPVNQKIVKIKNKLEISYKLYFIKTLRNSKEGLQTATTTRRKGREESRRYNH